MHLPPGWDALRLHTPQALRHHGSLPACEGNARPPAIVSLRGFTYGTCFMASLFLTPFMYLQQQGGAVEMGRCGWRRKQCWEGRSGMAQRPGGPSRLWAALSPPSRPLPVACLTQSTRRRPGPASLPHPEGGLSGAQRGRASATCLQGASPAPLPSPLLHALASTRTARRLTSAVKGVRMIMSASMTST